MQSNNNDYQWGGDSFRTYNSSPGAAWPARGGALGPALHPGTETYPENLTTKVLCEFSNLSAAKNLMAEFQLWLDQADNDDYFFFGFNTGEHDGSNDLVFRGRRWASTPLDDNGQVRWELNRVFLPDVGAKAAQNNGKVWLLWAFASNGNRHPDAQGAWLDNLNVERYDLPAGSANCQSQDPTITVAGVPGNVPVSKGLNLPPYADDFKSGALTEIAGMVGRLQQSGVNWVRLEFIAAPSQFNTDINANALTANNRLNHLDFRYYDQLIDQLCANNIGVLGLVTYQTLLDQSWKGQDPLPAEYKAAFTDILSQLVQYYDSRLRYWEVWNEPDYEESRLNPGPYADLLIAGYDAVKAVAPGDQVVFGGLASADINAGSYHAGLYSALQLAGRTNPGPFDIFALHPYPSKYYLPGGTLDLDPTVYIPIHDHGGPTALWKLMDLMNQTGDGNKPIWITEIGWLGSKDGNDATTQCAAVNERLVTREEQAIYLTTGFNVLFKATAWDWQSVQPAVPSVTKIFWYQYRDTGQDIDCNAAAAAFSPSWAASYVAQRVFPAATQTVVQWWYGLYSGDSPPLPNLSECTFRRYPAEDAIAACLNLQPTTLLPLVQGDGTATTASQ